MVHHVLYLPGLGDHKNSNVQINSLEKWRKHNVEPQFIKIIWADNEPFDKKLKKILKQVDLLTNNNNQVSLVGVSAGASMALNVYSARSSKINKVVFICGKIKNPQTLGGSYIKKNPALLDSVAASDKVISKLTNEDKSKMLTLHPFVDETVAKQDGIISGVKDKTIFSFFHAPSIFLAISLYKKIIINFLNPR